MRNEGRVARADWTEQDPADPQLFARLRKLGPARVYVRLGIGTGDGLHVEVPAASLAVGGELVVAPDVDRFGIRLPGWKEPDFAWFARRKGRGRPDYWQAAVQQHGEGGPALVLFFTATLDGLVIRTAPLPGASREGASLPGGEPKPEVGP